jgi:hypothetical protein
MRIQAPAFTSELSPVNLSFEVDSVESRVALLLGQRPSASFLVLTPRRADLHHLLLRTKYAVLIQL